MDDDQGIEQAICVSAPPVGDEGDTGECVPGEVLENSVKYHCEVHGLPMCMQVVGHETSKAATMSNTERKASQCSTVLCSRG